MSSTSRPGSRGESIWRAAEIPAAAAALERAGHSPWLAALLAQRGIADPGEASRFLAPSTDHLHPPAGLANLEAAIDHLVAARQAGRRVVVVGDYDVDGVAATAITLASLRACGIDARSILPHRIADGYGLSPPLVARAHAEGAEILLTVDCGTTSHQALAAALERRMTAIVVDHHLPGPELPDGVVLVNPRHPACRYPFPDLCAAGLALKLAMALGARLGRDLPVESLLRVACLGTIADVVPLRGENRVIAALGLAALARTRSHGLRALFRRARLEGPIGSEDVGYRLGPRLNAAGRLASAELALELLMTRDPGRAEALSEQLEELNRERREQERRVIAEARAGLPPGEAPAMVVGAAAGWHRGVVGIAAGRLARDLGRPSILLAIDGDEAVGSGRSVSGFDLFAFLEPWRNRLVRFGGHAQAVGLTVRTRDIDALAAAWCEAAAALPGVEAAATRVYDLAVPPEAVRPALLSELARLEPHGEGNPRPLLRIGPLERAGDPRLFGDDHLRLPARAADGNRVSLLGWGWAPRVERLSGRFEVLAHLERDRRLGGPELRLVDCRDHDGPP